jgi:REP element-mobilizing transposase RayT
MNPVNSSLLRKGRYSQPNRIYFITTVTQTRRPWFSEHNLARVVSRSITNEKVFRDAKVLCWVVMPDHVHLLIELGEVPLHKVINLWKSTSGHLLNRTIARKGRFWQKGYHDHALRKDENIKGTARYIIANPLRAGLAKKYGQYPYWNAVWL